MSVAYIVMVATTIWMAVMLAVELWDFVRELRAELRRVRELKKNDRPRDLPN